MLTSKEQRALEQTLEELKRLEDNGIHKGYFYSGWAGQQLQGLLKRTQCEHDQNEGRRGS